MADVAHASPLVEHDPPTCHFTGQDIVSLGINFVDDSWDPMEPHVIAPGLCDVARSNIASSL
jgi:hypothetical protein